VAVAAELVQLTGNLARWSGQGPAGPEDHDLLAAWIHSAQRPRRLRAEQVGVPSGMSRVWWDDPDVATRTLVIAVGWSLLWRSRAGG
jgi:hypothetical protein